MIHVLILLCALSQAPLREDSLTPEVLSLLQSGINAEQHNDLDGAISAFRKATDAAPGAAIAFFRLGEAYMRKRDYAAAIPPLKRAVELKPDSLPAHQLLGFALLAEGYPAEAIPHFELTHESAALGIAQLQAGRPEEAVPNLEAALAKNRNDPDLLYYLSRAGVELTSQSLDRLLSNFPDSARAHEAKGQTFYQMKMYSEAAAEYEKALSLRSDLPELRLELGQIYSAQSDWVRAEQEFRAETQLQSGNAEAAYRLGDALLQQGKMKEAAEELRRSNELRPDMAETLYSLGKALTVADPAEAERDLNRVVAMEKDTSLAGSAYLALAAIHRKQGKAELAAKEMQEFRRIQALNTPQPHNP